jgi:hypothetical protein
MKMAYGNSGEEQMTLYQRRIGVSIDKFRNLLSDADFTLLDPATCTWAEFTAQVAAGASAPPKM